MKCKRVAIILLALVTMVSTLSMQVFAENEIKVLLDGQELIFDVPPQLIDNRTMVPMRKIFEAMGANVDWNGDTQTVTATKDDITVIMQIDNKVINVNGENITLDVPPQLVDSRTLVPARAVAESFGGGGHKNASGCKIFGSFDDVKQQLIDNTLQILGW